MRASRRWWRTEKNTSIPKQPPKKKKNLNQSAFLWNGKQKTVNVYGKQKLEMEQMDCLTHTLNYMLIR